MKIKVSQLRKIIKEEISKLEEAPRKPASLYLQQRMRGVGGRSAPRASRPDIDIDGAVLETSKGETFTVESAYLRLVDPSDPSFGEFVVTFDASELKKHPYNDPVVLRSIRKALMDHGMSAAGATDVEWSESGMQGRGSLSFDVVHDFISEWPEHSIHLD